MYHHFRHMSIENVCFCRYFSIFFTAYAKKFKTSHIVMQIHLFHGFRVDIFSLKKIIRIIKTRFLGDNYFMPHLI